MGEFAAMLTVIKARGPHNLGEGRDEVLANAVALMTRTFVPCLPLGHGLPSKLKWTIGNARRLSPS